MKRFVMQVIANATTVLAVLLCALIVPVLCLHKLHPISCEGDYLVECSLWRCMHYRHR